MCLVVRVLVLLKIKCVVWVSVLMVWFCVINKLFFVRVFVVMVRVIGVVNERV